MAEGGLLLLRIDRPRKESCFPFVIFSIGLPLCLALLERSFPYEYKTQEKRSIILTASGFLFFFVFYRLDDYFDFDEFGFLLRLLNSEIVRRPQTQIQTRS